MTIPTPYLDLDRGRKIINISDPALMVQQQQSRRRRQTNRVELTPSQDGDRFKVVDSTKTIGGIGVSEIMSFAGVLHSVPFMGVVFGALPMYGRSGYSERHVASEAEGEALPRAYIPKNADELDLWAIEDLVQYKTEGGVAIFAGVQYFGHGALVPLVLRGEWGVSIKRIDADRFLLAIERNRVAEIKTIVGNLLVNGNMGYLKNVKKIYTFVLDMSDPEARDMYPSFVKGHLSRLQEAVKDGKPWIQEAEGIKEKGTKKSVGFRAGIPLIAHATWEASYKDETSGQIDENPDSFEKSVEKQSNLTHLQNVFKKPNRYRAYKHVHKGTKILARLWKQGPEETSLLDYEKELEMRWEYHNDGANSHSFEKGMNKLYKFTGMQDQLEKVWTGENRMGYFGIQFVLSTDGRKLKYLADNETFATRNVVFRGNEIVKDYFETKGDPSGLCRKKRFRYKHCVEKFRKDTAQALTILKKKIEEYSQEDWNKEGDVMSQLVDIGNLVFETPFTIQAVLDTVPETFDLKYRVEGQKFKPVNLSGNQLPRN